MQKILCKPVYLATLLILFVLSSPAPVLAQKQTLLRWDFSTATAIESRSRLISAPASFSVKGIAGTYFPRSDCDACQRTLTDFSYSANLFEEYIGGEYPYLTVTTTAAVNLKQIKIKTAANDKARFFVSLEISPRNAPPPSWANPGQGYRTLGTFEHEGLASERQSINGPGILEPGTYHIRLRSSAPFSTTSFDIRDLELIGTSGISLALYPWVPRLDQFKQVITAAWAKANPDVPLTYVSPENWDGGYSNDPPPNVEVFVFDGIFLDYFVSSGFLAALRPEEIEAPADFLPYAWNDSKVGNVHYAIPQIGCGNILFYRQDDRALAQANTLSQIAEAIGQCDNDSIPPPEGKNLIVDLSGSTTDACFYLEALQDLTGRYDPNPKLPPPDGLNATAVTNLHSLLNVSCVLPSVTASNVPYQGGAWFGQGKGRALIGFTETLSAMGDGRKTVAFKLMPFANTNNVTLFYVDLVGINKSVTDPARRALALKLANLVASSGVVVDSFGPSPDAPYPQYLMPVRKSVFQALQTNDPLYAQMYQLVLRSNPRMFRIGAGSRMWLKNTKSAIRQQILSGFKLLKKTGRPK